MPPRRRDAKPLLTADQLRELMARNNLRQIDAAWIAGSGVRQARAWALDEYAISQAAALVLMAYDEGKIDARWLRDHIGAPPPGVED